MADALMAAPGLSRVAYAFSTPPARSQSPGAEPAVTGRDRSALTIAKVSPPDVDRHAAGAWHCELIH